MKKPKPGPLATPLRIKLRPATEAHVLFGLWTKEQAHRHEWLERFRIFAEKRSKLDLLFEHYGISKSGVAGEDYRELALRLAEEFLDGFKVEEVTIDERDQRQVERSARITRLLLDVDSVREHERQNGRECTDPEAIDILKKGYGARPKLSATTETRSFCNTLSMARDRKRNLLLGLYERAQSMGPGMVKQFAESFLDPFTK